MRRSEEMADPVRLRAERLATASSCCGFLGEVTLTDSAVIILFAGMLGAGDALSMITTSALPLLNGLCIIPMAGLAMKIGMRRQILRACFCASAAYFTAVASPFFGEAGVMVLIASVFLFAFSLTGFIAGWFPLLDTFLEPERRTLFFSRMRFCHQLSGTVFLFLVGFVIGGNPPVWGLQLVLLAAAVIFTGRAAAISRIPVFEGRQNESAGFLSGLNTVVGNKPMAGFSLYFFLLNLTAFGTVPLMMLYLKNGLNAPDNVIVLISACSLSGMLFGYLCIGRLLKRIGMKHTFLLLHFIFFAVNGGLFLIGGRSMATYLLIAFFLLVYSFAAAASSIVASAEMMKLASPGNKIMAMAFNGAFFYGGSGLSRFLTSLLLGSGMFAAEWQLGTTTVCRYRTFLLLYCAAILLAAPFLLLVPAVNSGKSNKP